MIEIPPSRTNAKQVIVVRTDLNMRKGKMVAQGSHASLGVVLLIQKDAELQHYSSEVHEAFKEWIAGSFTKVCVGVPSEDALMVVYEAAAADRLPVKLIMDLGHTEFHGVPTRTCLAIGPCWNGMIDKITGELKLL
jgi:PTH2 family peptidyl-tRNA hydrolase